MSNQSSNQTITIKKYANRRLYNTATSTYVTLEDLSAMVKEGTKFNVYDAKSSEDITRSVLTQIIVEEENKTDQQNLLPINFLRQLIGFYGNSMQWMVPKYLEHSMELLSGNQDKIQSYFTEAFGNMFPFGSTLEEMSKQNMAMFENTFRMLSPMASFNFGLNDVLDAMSKTTGINMNPLATMTSSASTNNTDASVTNNTVTNNKSDAKTNVSSTTCATNTTNNTNKSSVSDNSTSNNSSSSNTTKAAACPLTSSSSKNDDSNTSKSAATVTSLKPKADTSASSTATASITPMPNVQMAAAANNVSDDMQQKIANLQKQLADLAKSRA